MANSKLPKFTLTHNEQKARWAPGSLPVNIASPVARPCLLAGSLLIFANFLNLSGKRAISEVSQCAEKAAFFGRRTLADADG